MARDKESEETFKPFKKRTVHDHHLKKRTVYDHHRAMEPLKQASGTMGFVAVKIAPTVEKSPSRKKRALRAAFVAIRNASTVEKSPSRKKSALRAARKKATLAPKDF